MKHLIIFLITALFLTGCMREDNHSSAMKIMSREDNQTHHYRPIHPDHPNWSIHQLSKTITLRTDTEQIKVSTRRISTQPKVFFYDTFIETIKSILPIWDPTYMIVRDNGNIIAYVRASDQKVEVMAASSSTQNHLEENKLIFQCDTNHSLATVTTSLKTINYSIQKEEVYNQTLSIMPLASHRRFTILNKNAMTDHSSSQGKEVESPFNMLGTAIFHTSELPLPERTATAWYLTVMNMTCQ